MGLANDLVEQPLRSGCGFVGTRVPFIETPVDSNTPRNNDVAAIATDIYAGAYGSSVANLLCAALEVDVQPTEGVRTLTVSGRPPCSASSAARDA